MSQIFRVSTPALEGDYRKQTLEASLDVVSLQLTSPQSYTLRSLSAPNRVLSELNDQRLSATRMVAPIFATSTASMFLCLRGLQFQKILRLRLPL